MEHYCRFCEKVFNRSYKNKIVPNVLRKKIPTQQRRNQRKIRKMRTVSENSLLSRNRKMKMVRRRRRKIKKSVDMEDESMSDNVHSDANPWEKLIEKVMNDMNSDWEEQLTIHMY